MISGEELKEWLASSRSRVRRAFSAFNAVRMLNKKTGTRLQGHEAR
jgi:hypothetical protein